MTGERMNDLAARKKDAYERLAALLVEFSTIAATHSLQKQSEQHARTWIERMFSIFGWNPADPGEVIQEFQIAGREARRSRGTGERHHTRPDYALVVNGLRMFYLDAKKFAVNLETDMNAAFQIRTYGWSAGMRLGYICDFEELGIYDTRIKPRQNDDARVARVLYLRHDQYLENFDTLWEYLSREAVMDGSLARMHPDDRLPKGTTSLDQEFEAFLTEWRLEIARLIVRQEEIRDMRIVSAAAQRILDRILFIRFCEEIGLEETGTVNSLGSRGDFWPDFAEENERRWRHVYDGILFPHSEEDDPTGVEHHLLRFSIKGRVFRKMIENLYYPNPYRFDAIPLETLGGVYERYLGKQLRLVGGKVVDEYKPEYQRSKGAVYTPAWVVGRVVDRALGPLLDGADPERILSLRILDPACGSGSFLLGVYTHLETRILDWCRKRGEHKGPYATYDSRGWRLTPTAARRIIDYCLFGVDIDAEAVEIARMSLALRYVERTAIDGPDEPSDMLRGIGRNIRHGNALVEPDILGLGIDAERLMDLVPFDWRHERHGFGAVMNEGGFNAVVGNPPYIEVKRYREWLPDMYRYLKSSGRYETAAQGKTDIAMPFVELGVRLLRPGGRLGFIVQNRFFRTDYGEHTRRWLRREKLLAEIEDFRDLQIFPKRTTYTAILALQRGSEAFRYRTFDSTHDAETGQPCLDARINVSEIDDTVWAFDQPDLMRLHRDLRGKFGALGDHAGVEIIVGLQVLWGQAYQFRLVDMDEKLFFGENADGRRYYLNTATMRPMCRNRAFYPFRPDNADVWVIFPYEIENGEAREIRWKELEERFRKTADYLKERRRDIKKAVECFPEPDRWHLYRYPKNLVEQARRKVLFPSTIEDTIAAVDSDGTIYQDNVRIQGMVFSDPDVDLTTVAAIMNSSLFSALARLKAAPNDSGWRQFNRQFAGLVPFPMNAVRDTKFARPIAELAEKIGRLQAQALKPSSEGAMAAVEAALDHCWRQLDERVCDLYELDAEQRAVAARYPRRVDRVELLRRQAALAKTPDVSTDDETDDD